MSSIYWYQVCSAENCCTATAESITNAMTIFAREWVNKSCIAQIKKTGTSSHGNSTEPRRHYGTCSEKQSFINDFNLGLWNLEQMLKNVKLIVYSSLNGSIGALVGPCFWLFGNVPLWYCHRIEWPPLCKAPDQNKGSRNHPLSFKRLQRAPRKQVWLSWIPEDVLFCLSNPRHVSRQ